MYYNHITSRKDPKTGKRKQNPVSVLFIICAVIVPVISFAFNYIYINLNSFMMGFQFSDNGVRSFVGFKNFKVIFDEIFIDESNYFQPISYKRHMMETQQVNLYN